MRELSPQATEGVLRRIPQLPVKKLFYPNNVIARPKAVAIRVPVCFQGQRCGGRRDRVPATPILPLRDDTQAARCRELPEKTLETVRRVVSRVFEGSRLCLAVQRNDCGRRHLIRLASLGTFPSNPSGPAGQLPLKGAPRWEGLRRCCRRIIPNSQFLECVSKVRDVQFRAYQAAFQGDFPKAYWLQVEEKQHRNAALDAENACSGF